MLSTSGTKKEYMENILDCYLHTIIEHFGLFFFILPWQSWIYAAVLSIKCD
jgi:hypothetical protein